MIVEQDPLSTLLDYLHATPAMRSLVAEIEQKAGYEHAKVTAEAWWRSSRGLNRRGNEPPS